MTPDLPALAPVAIEARSYGVVRTVPVRLVVIHTAETLERNDSAEGVARYFAGLKERAASAHFCVDNDSAVQCVPLDRVAYAAPGANHDGIQIELAGRAAQNASAWGDGYSKALLERAAHLTAVLLDRYKLPTQIVGVKGLLVGEKGITGHRWVSDAWKRSTHTDPGSAFPWLGFARRVRDIRAGKP